MWPAGGKVRGQSAGDCGGCQANINTIAVWNWFQELVDDVSSFPEGCERTLVLIFSQIFKEIFKKISESHGKKYPLQKLEHMSCTISPDCWYNQRTDQGHHLGNAQQKW